MPVTVLSRSTINLAAHISATLRISGIKMNTSQGFRAQELCSRKLWELVSDQEPIGKAELEAAGYKID